MRRHRFERGVDPELQSRRDSSGRRVCCSTSPGGRPGPIVDEVGVSSHLPEPVRAISPPSEPHREDARHGACPTMKWPGGLAKTRDGGPCRPMAGVDGHAAESVGSTLQSRRTSSKRWVRGRGIRSGAPGGPDRRNRSARGRTPKRGVADRPSAPAAWSTAGYHEAITYSFVDAALQSLLDPDVVSDPLSRTPFPPSSRSCAPTCGWGFAGALPCATSIDRSAASGSSKRGFAFDANPALRARIGDVERWGDPGSRPGLGHRPGALHRGRRRWGRPSPSNGGSDARGRSISSTSSRTRKP